MTKSSINKEYIEKRVDDWAERITKLYSLIKDWLASNSAYEVQEKNDVRMHEELMQKHGVPERFLPSLDIYFEGRILATIKPIGLWVIGANGRIDLLTKEGAIMLIDASEKFKNPQWIAYSRPKIGSGVDFSKDYLFNLIGVK